MLINIASRQSEQDARLSAIKFVDIYAGSLPADIAGITLGTKLGRLTLAAGAFGATDSSGNSAIDASKWTDETNATAGTAAYAVALQTNGTTIVEIWSCGLSGSGKELILNNTTILSGATIHAVALTRAYPVGSL